MFLLGSLTSTYMPVLNRHRLPGTVLKIPEPAVPVLMQIGSVPSAELQKAYDLIVVGGGPAGVAGALKGAYLGKRVLLIDKPKAAPEGGGLDLFFSGPTGLFSKALRDCSKAYDIGSLDAMGLDRDVIFKQVQNSCLRLARNNAQTGVAMLEKFKIGYLQGEATLDLGLFNGRTKTDVVKLNVRLTQAPSDIVTLTSEKVLLCTGSYAAQPPGIPFDNKIVLDSDSVNGLNFLPKEVVVAGSGIIAIEMANIFRKLGASVTMIVRGSALAALERIGLDETIAELLLLGLNKQGVTVLENTVVDDFTLCEGCREHSLRIGGEGGDTVSLALKTRDEAGVLQPAGALEADLYLACLGRKPRARGTSLELEANGVKLVEGSGHIKVDDCFQTTQPGIYAAGDCVVGPALASTGVDQAQRAVEAMFGCTGQVCTGEGETPFPIGMWTIPEVGYYGLTLKEALERGHDADVGVATYDMCLRGRVFAPDGMLKLVFDRQSAVILGVHIIGTDACELVHYGMDLVAKRATLFDVIGTLFTAVTFHELFKEAAFAGNEKLEFGIEWQELLGQLQMSMATTGTPGEKELREKFDQIDTSGDGSLDAVELLEVFKGLGSEASPNLVANLVRLADEDGNGTIEWPEFQRIFQVLEKISGEPAG